jgi:hypothetical protein
MGKNLVAIILLIYAVFGQGLLDLADTKPQPEPVNVAILDIETPSDSIQARISKFSEIITDPSDRAKIAIFNHEFATRCLSYDATVQNVNDVYTLAGKIFFQKSLVDKYEGLAEEVVSLLEYCITNEDHVITRTEKEKIHDNFMGVAWVLTQRVE